MNRSVLPALVVAGLFLAGCGPAVTYVSQDLTKMSPKPEGYEMPFSYHSADRPHKVLGAMTVSSKIKPSFREMSTFDQLLTEMQKRARKLGADAIVDLKTVDSQKGGDRGALSLVGTLIIYTAPPALSSR
jgi:hypothetical protein